MRGQQVGEGIVIPRSSSYKFVQYMRYHAKVNISQMCRSLLVPSFFNNHSALKQPKGTRCRI